jgi:hypothetical protein
VPQLIRSRRGLISGADVAHSRFSLAVVFTPRRSHPLAASATGPLLLRYALAMPKEPKPRDVDFHEVTDSAVYADDRNFYKVEKWTRDGTKVDNLLYAGNSLGRASEIFTRAIKADAANVAKLPELLKRPPS